MYFKNRVEIFFTIFFLKNAITVLFCLPDIQSIYFKNMFTRLKSSMISSPTFEANKKKSLKKALIIQ